MFQIKSDVQRQKTVKRIEALRAQLEQVRRERRPEVAADFEASLVPEIQQFEAQIGEYDRLRREGNGKEPSQ